MDCAPSTAADHLMTEEKLTCSAWHRVAPIFGSLS